MGVRKWRDLRREKLSPETLERIDREVEAEIIEADLRALREALGLTQAELAERLGRAQGELSRMERRGDHLVSTLRAYVEALGGELELVARIGDKEVRLIGV